MNGCGAAIPSLTLCIRAQRALLENGIDASVVKLDPSLTRRGCAYGIEFDCNSAHTVRAVLSKGGIRVTQYIDFGGGVPI